MFFIYSTLCTTIVIMLGLFILCYLEGCTPSQLFGRDERLVAIIRIPFSYIHEYYNSGDWDAKPIHTAERTTYIDVYCYENNHGKRRLNINEYNYHGPSNYYKNRPLYADLLSWKNGANPMKFPSYQEIRSGKTEISHNFGKIYYE